MNRNDVITSVSKDPRYIQACKNITHNNNLCDDLYQEVMILLMTEKKSCIIEMYINDKLLYYFIYLCKLLYRPTSKTSQFTRKHKGILECNLQTVSEFRFDLIIENEKEETLIDLAIQDLAKKKQNRKLNYEQNLINAIIREGEMKSLIKKTGITYRSMKSTIEGFKIRIKNESTAI